MFLPDQACFRHTLWPNKSVVLCSALDKLNIHHTSSKAFLTQHTSQTSVMHTTQQVLPTVRVVWSVSSSYQSPSNSAWSWFHWHPGCSEKDLKSKSGWCNTCKQLSANSENVVVAQHSRTECWQRTCTGCCGPHRVFPAATKPQYRWPWNGLEEVVFIH